MRSSIKVILGILLLFVSGVNAQVEERSRPDGWENLVYGGRFMDRLEPSPVHNKLTSDTWGVDAVKPRDIKIGIEHPDWSYWGGNVKKVGDTYHFFVCRWAENHPKGHMAWHGSDVVRATAPNLWGPYTPAEEIGGGHNPEIFQAQDGSYVLYVIGAGYYAPGITGPWKKGKITYDARNRRVHDGHSNFSFSQREDGSILAVCRGGGIWISETGLTPFEQVTNERTYPKVRGNFEDPVIWKTEIQYHMIVNDWSGRIAWYLRSPNGIDWVVDAGEAYLPGIDNYEDGTKVDWYKYERLKVMQDGFGRAHQAFFAVIDYDKRKDLPNDIHNSKNINMPLTVGRRLQVLNKAPLSAETQTIKVKVLAEPGFNPHKDMDVASLRFGAPQNVDFGEGGRVTQSTKDGADLILTFDAIGNGFTSKNFTGKLLGKTKNGKLLFGYSRLPGVTYKSAFLSAMLPRACYTNGKLELRMEVKNYGIVASDETPVSVRMSGNGFDQTFKATVPALKPYEKVTVKIAAAVKLDPAKKYDFAVTADTQSTALYDSNGNEKVSLGTASPDVISVNLGGKDHSVGANTPAGMNRIFNWNNALGASGSLNALIDGSGSATKASVSWKASTCWQDGSAKGAGSAQLQRSYLDDGNGGFSVEVSNVPFEKFQVVVYFSSGSDDANILPVTVGGMELKPTEPFERWNKKPQLGAHNSATSGVLTGGSFTIIGSARHDVNRCSISGFQILKESNL